MASINWNVTIPVKGASKVLLNAGGVTKITCTKRGIYKLLARGGNGGGTSMSSEQEGSVVKPGISSSGGVGGTTIVYKVMNVGDVIYYVGGGNAGHTYYTNDRHEEGAAGWNGGGNGKNFGNVNRGASGGASYFMIGTPWDIREIYNNKSLTNVLGIAGGGGGGKGGLGSNNHSASSYTSGYGGAGGGNPSGGGGRALRRINDLDYGEITELPGDKQSDGFSWETMWGNASTWGGCGGAGYICGTSSDNFGGNGGVGWINPSFATVTHKNKKWAGSTLKGGTEAAGIYWEKTWISPLIYYGDAEVDSVYYGNKELDTIYYGNREIG